ncbi:MAG: EamA family transporter [Myxococcales bacterium]|nr:EamA family transporter [Myxococcales bacterium]
MRSRFLALTLIWGASFLFIKIGVEALAPIQVAFGRMAFGTIALLLATAVRKERLPGSLRVWAQLFVAAALLNTVPFTLFAYAEQRIPSALASIGNATTPLFTLLFALFMLPDERPTAQRTVGLVIGFAGVMVVLRAWRGLSAGPDVSGMLLVLAAAACYGLGGVYLRRNLSSSGYSSLALSAAQLLVGTLQLIVLVPLLSTTPAHIPTRAILAIFTLGAFGTGVAYLLQYGLIRTAGATVASTVTYFIPIVSIILGVLLLGEHLAWNAPVGAAIIIAGALVSRRGPRPATDRAAVTPVVTRVGSG